MDIMSYALAKDYTNMVAFGFSKVAIDDSTGTITVELTDGSSASWTFPKPANGKDGLGIKSVNAELVTVDDKQEYHLIVTYSDDSTYDAGKFPEQMINISQEEGNALKKSAVDGGLYVPASAVEYSKDEKNIAKAGSDGGIFVPETDLSDCVKKEEGKGLSTNDYTDKDKKEVEKVKDKVDVQQKAEDKGKILGIDENGRVTPVTGGGTQIDDTSTDATDKTWSVKKIFDSIKNVFTNHTIKAINMYDDVEIISDGNGLHIQYSDTEITLDGNRLIFHNIAGGESRVTLDDGRLFLEGSPYWSKNATIEMSANGEDGESFININADRFNLNGNPLSVSPEIFHVVGVADKGVTPGGDGHSVTAKELWDAGVRGGTYIIFCHSNTSTSQRFFIGYVEMWLGASDNPSINDATIISLTDNTDHMRYGTYDGVERLFYTGGDEGTYCSMDFIKFSNYVDN